MAFKFDSFDSSIVIDGWEAGIGESAHVGLADMRCVNLVSAPGEIAVNFATTTNSLGFSSGTVVSADPATDIVTVTVGANPLVTGQAIQFTGASLPGGLLAATLYWIVVQSPTSFKVYTSPVLQNAFLVNITSTGTGTFGTTGTMAKPTAKAYQNTMANGVVRYFMVDVNGRVYEYSLTFGGVWIWLGNTTLTGANGNGLIVYQNYLFVFRNNRIDYMNLATDVWTYDWQILNTLVGVNNIHFAYLGQDNVVYYTDGQYIGSFFKKVNGPPDTIVFDPAVGATYTWAQQALQLPSTEIAQSLAELGQNLLIGGILNAIYPWDRLSTSFSYPILLSENFISHLLTVNTNTYIWAGIRGRIYVTNGSQANLYKKVPDHISNTVEPYFQWGDVATIKNQLYFGVSCTDNAGTAIPEYGGVWAIDLDTEALRISHKLSYNTYAGIASVILPMVIVSPATTPAGSGFFAGWDSGVGTFGIDNTINTPYIGSQATIDTDLIPIGTFDKPRDFTRVEFKLVRPMVNGESITLRYRLLFGLQDSVTPPSQYITLVTDSTVGDISISKEVNFKNAQWVQFKIILNSTNTTPSYVRLKQIRITGLVGPTVQQSQQLSL